MKKFTTGITLAMFSVFTIAGGPQLAEGQGILGAGDPIIAIDFDGFPNSSYPALEGPGNVADQISSTKYLNFGKEGTGFIMTPSFGSSIIQSLQLTTAGDARERDPLTYDLFGTNDPITSGDNSLGDQESWTLINSGFTGLNFDPGREAPGQIQDFASSTAYMSYKVIFPTVVDPEAANSMQVADVALFTGAGGSGSQILASGDSALAVTNSLTSGSSYPGAESPLNVIDDDPSTKYLNFGKETSGLIVSPIFGASTVRSMVFTTANDFPERDPASWALHGTNDPITSADNSFGDAENWTLVSTGTVELPETRLATGPVLSFSNDTSFSSYRLVFPTIKDTAATDSLQIADFQMFESTDGTGTPVVGFLDDVVAIDLGSQSRYPLAENPQSVLDGDVNTKYLNFGKENAGFVITPSSGPAIVESFQITTADDVEARDPSSWELYGTNSPITSIDNTFGAEELWTLIDTGSLDLPLDRLTAGARVAVNNTTEYASYRMVFPTVRDATGAESLQFSEIQFFTNFVDGDFNSDGFWDCADIDALVAAIADGSTDLGFDMNGDGVIDQSDITNDGSGWLAVGGAKNPAATGGNPFLAGDANLDGSVDVSDFNEWNNNKFTAVAAWCRGDFNADGSVDVSDFNVWNQTKFTSSATITVVPEPSFGFCWLFAVGLTGSLIRRVSRRAP